MQLPGFIGFVSVLILACDSDDKGWKINVRRNNNATSGTTVTILCNFSYPEKHHTNDVKVYWKHLAIKDNSNCSKDDIDRNAFVFHPNKTCVLDKYKQKTSLIGDKDKGNCSLQITNIESSDQNLYVRIFVDKEKFSYRKETQFVTITVNGTGLKPDTSKTVTAYYTTPAFSSSETTITNEDHPKSTDSETTLHVVIPVAVAIVILSLAIGIFFFKKRKRSLIVSREDSGYYANFSRALSNPPKREVSSNTQDKKLPQRKVVDDPVYINVKAPPGHMDQNTDFVDNIYANMDYRN